MKIQAANISKLFQEKSKKSLNYFSSGRVDGFLTLCERLVATERELFCETNLCLITL